MAVRLDRFVSENSGSARSLARDMIRRGRVSVDGIVVTRPETKISGSAAVAIDGKALPSSKYIYIMMNKPAGVLSSTQDRQHRTVIDILPDELKVRGLFPVGRLDKDTTGLLILTNDGDFAHSVISPRRHVKKRYLAQTEGTPTQQDALRFEEGLTLADGTRCMPSKLEVIGENLCIVTVEEGKYHQVKRMLAACGTPVKSLHRISIGGLELGNCLAESAYRVLTEEDLEQIFS